MDLYSPHRSIHALSIYRPLLIYRYTEWVTFDHLTATPDWSAAANWGRELYNHTMLPVPDATFDCENTNLVDAPEQQARVAELSRQLRAGWRAALPPGDSR